jgi:hypothetical protein
MSLVYMSRYIDVWLASLCQISRLRLDVAFAVSVS